MNSVTAAKKYKRVIQLEFNEISRDIIDKLINEKGLLPNFKQINQNWTYFTTSSEKEYHLIEPWIQWCTVHTGKNFSEHKVFHLSDVHTLEYPQIWEELSHGGIESGIIGSMNITRGKCRGGTFFPDPWSQKNQAYPKSLKHLWGLIAEKFQGYATTKMSLIDLLLMFKACLPFKLSVSIYGRIYWQWLIQKFKPKSKWKLAGIFDLLFAEIFKSILKSTNYGFYTLFLNVNAHYQHHYWRAFDMSPFNSDIKYSDIEEGDDPVTFGYQLYDEIIGDVLEITKNDPDTLIMILSGLSQVPYTQDEPQGGMNYYRLSNHKLFIKSLRLKGRAYPLMSRDWEYRYRNEAECKIALETLSNLYVNNEKLFKLRQDTPGYIFIETNYTKMVKPEEFITNQDNKQLFKFYDVFSNIAIKSGHHIGVGSLWVSDANMVTKNGEAFPLKNVYNITLSALGK